MVRGLAIRCWYLLALGLVALGLAACEVDQSAERAAWLRNTLIFDRYGDIARSPEKVAAQFARMEAELYDFMRATLPQFRRDVLEPRGVDTSSAFLSSATRSVQLVGDPHVENIGTFLIGDELVVEFNDFDSAAYGSYHLDVWRLALSWYAAGAGSSFTRTTEEDWLAAAEEVAAGYASEVVEHAASAHEPLRAMGSVLIDLEDEAWEDAEEQAVLNRFTEEADGKRQFRVSEELVPLEEDISRWLVTQLDTWKRTLPDEGRQLGEFLGGARRLGAGVASLALERYYLLFAGTTPALDDDVFVEWKETRDPCVIALVASALGRDFPANGQRVVVLGRRAQASAESDAFAGWIGDETWSFRSRQNRGSHGGMRRSRLEKLLRDGRFSASDIAEAAFYSGVLLARAHMRAPTRDGTESASALRAVLAGKELEFAQETRERVAFFGPRLVDDHRLFQILLKRHGPLLGGRN